MSTIDTSLNSSATVTLKDIWVRLIRKREVSEEESMRVLRASTVIWGLAGTAFALIITGNAKNILDSWWTLSGVFAGGMLGLFLLGIIVRKAGNLAGVTATIVGIIAILYLSAGWIPDELKLPLHSNLTIVVGTLTIFLVGALLSKFIPLRK